MIREELCVVVYKRHCAVNSIDVATGLHNEGVL